MTNFTILPGGHVIITDVLKDGLNGTGNTIDPATLTGNLQWSQDTGALGSGVASGVNDSIYEFTSAGQLGNPPALGVTVLTVVATAPAGGGAAVTGQCSVTVGAAPLASMVFTGVVG
jgi:hypothetical protein